MLYETRMHLCLKVKKTGCLINVADAPCFILVLLVLQLLMIASPCP